MTIDTPNRELLALNETGSNFRQQPATSPPTFNLLIYILTECDNWGKYNTFDDSQKSTRQESEIEECLNIGQQFCKIGFSYVGQRLPSLNLCD